MCCAEKGSTGIRHSRRRCEHLQANRASAVEARQDGGSNGSEWPFGVHRQGNVSYWILKQNWKWLMCSSKRIEKQIKDIQEKAETVKMEVCYNCASQAAIGFADHPIDHTDSISGATVTTTSGRSMSIAYHDIQNKIPRDTQPISTRSSKIALICYQ